MNPGYQLPEVEYSLRKVDVKAIIMPETFKTQKYYEMLATLIPSLATSKTTIEGNTVNSLKHVIVYTDKHLP
jgi:fatty-acyl-CoA synthase